MKQDNNLKNLCEAMNYIGLAAFYLSQDFPEDEVPSTYLLKNLIRSPKISLESQALIDEYYRTKLIFRTKSVLDFDLSEITLAKVLNTTPDIVFMIDRVYTGKVDGYLLVGAESDIGVQIGQMMIINKYGFIQNPQIEWKSPIHPRNFAKLKYCHSKFIPPFKPNGY